MTWQSAASTLRRIVLACVWAVATLIVALLHGDYAPVSVHNCSVRDGGAGPVVFQAALRNHGDKPVRLVRVLATTSGGSFVEYTFHGDISADYWTYARTSNALNENLYTLEQQLGWVWNCYVHEVEYRDGTIWIGPSPL